MPAVVIAQTLSNSLSFTQNPFSSITQQTTTLLPTKPKSLLHKHPLYQSTQSKLSLQFKEKILCLEIMGVDCGKALSLNPSLHTASLHSIHAIISYLQSKGIYEKDLAKIFGTCPEILTSDIKSDLSPVFNFLSFDLKVPDHKFRQVINRCPRLLVSSVRDQLKPSLHYLQRLGFRDLATLAYQDPVLLASSVENTLVPKMEYLMGLGFSKKEVKNMVLRCPGLLTFNVENNYKPKYEYFVEKIEGQLEELKEFPHYFSFSLDKRIKPRHEVVVESGMKISLPLMLKTTDEEFSKLIKHGNPKLFNKN